MSKTEKQKSLSGPNQASGSSMDAVEQATQIWRTVSQAARAKRKSREPADPTDKRASDVQAEHRRSKRPESYHSGMRDSLHSQKRDSRQSQKHDSYQSKRRESYHGESKLNGGVREDPSGEPPEEPRSSGESSEVVKMPPSVFNNNKLAHLALQGKPRGKRAAEPEEPRSSGESSEVVKMPAALFNNNKLAYLKLHGKTHRQPSSAGPADPSSSEESSDGDDMPRAKPNSNEPITEQFRGRRPRPQEPVAGWPPHFGQQRTATEPTPRNRAGSEGTSTFIPVERLHGSQSSLNSQSSGHNIPRRPVGLNNGSFSHSQLSNSHSFTQLAPAATEPVAMGVSTPGFLKKGTHGKTASNAHKRASRDFSHRLSTDHKRISREASRRLSTDRKRTSRDLSHHQNTDYENLNRSDGSARNTADKKKPKEAHSREESASKFLKSFKERTAKAAKGVERAGRGLFRRREQPKAPTIDYSKYECTIITLPLAEQARKTRIVKRIEDSIDKTEFWMPALPWRCIDYLNYKGVDSEGLYRIPGSTSEVRMWRARFDQEGDIDLFFEPDLYDINAIGSLFKSWLRELPDEIFPQRDQFYFSQKYHEFISCPSELKQYLSHMHPYNYYMLFAVTCHLSLLYAYEEQNKMSFQNLYVCFGPCLGLNGDCFKWLVGDWRACFSGCEVEHPAIIEEYGILGYDDIPVQVDPQVAVAAAIARRGLNPDQAPGTSSSSDRPATGGGSSRPASVRQGGSRPVSIRSGNSRPASIREGGSRPASIRGLFARVTGSRPSSAEKSISRPSTGEGFARRPSDLDVPIKQNPKPVPQLATLPGVGPPPGTMEYELMKHREERDNLLPLEMLDLEHFNKRRSIEAKYDTATTLALQEAEHEAFNKERNLPYHERPSRHRPWTYKPPPETKTMWRPDRREASLSDEERTPSRMETYPVDPKRGIHRLHPRSPERYRVAHSPDARSRSGQSSGSRSPETRPRNPVYPPLPPDHPLVTGEFPPEGRSPYDIIAEKGDPWDPRFAHLDVETHAAILLDMEKRKKKEKKRAAAIAAATAAAAAGPAGPAGAAGPAVPPRLPSSVEMPDLRKHLRGDTPPQAALLPRKIPPGGTPLKSAGSRTLAGESRKVSASESRKGAAAESRRPATVGESSKAAAGPSSKAASGMSSKTAAEKYRLGRSASNASRDSEISEDEGEVDNRNFVERFMAHPDDPPGTPPVNKEFYLRIQKSKEALRNHVPSERTGPNKHLILRPAGHQRSISQLPELDLGQPISPTFATRRGS